VEQMKNLSSNLNFTAIDFETANEQRHSACAVGLVRVEAGSIVKKKALLIRPPENFFEFSHIHGITWKQVKDAPTFMEIWPEIKPLITKVDFLAAHNAPFDKSVLINTCRHYGIEEPSVEFECTVQLARQVFGIYPTKLPNVCRRLHISLDNHHDALSDALACAQIVLRAAAAMQGKGQ